MGADVAGVVVHRWSTERIFRWPVISLSPTQPKFDCSPSVRHIRFYVKDFRHCIWHTRTCGHEFTNCETRCVDTFSTAAMSAPLSPDSLR